ncbi:MULTISPECIES: hypothetical protein [Pseudomonas]|uniref:Transposase n=1 Tax=Serpens gallinarum TaxID=2763075 RepID=A0ABR8TQR2_9PSED|nr:MULTISPECIES: hypothetical protein [Pseudomonas]MBD7977974.1 hypothetical protein [Serpens gallinarum]MBF0674732.1 hypothetical protein [Pseudomonas sp.]
MRTIVIKRPFSQAAQKAIGPAATFHLTMATLGQYLFANISGIKAAAHLQVPHAKKTWRRVQTSVSTLKVRHAALLVMLLGDGNQRYIKAARLSSY